MNISVGKLTIFFKEVWLEIRKVNWPTRQATIRYTLIVIAVSLVVALYLGLLDAIFNTIFNKISSFISL